MVSVLNDFNSSDVSFYYRNLENLLEKYTNHNREDISSISNFIINNSEKFVLKAQQNLTNIHICKHESGLKVPLNVNEEGAILIPIGIILGKGCFRKTELAIALSKNLPSIIVNSKQNLQNEIRSHNGIKKTTDIKKGVLERTADQENRILKKIASLMETHEEIEGLLKYYTSIKYEKKWKDDEGFQQLDHSKSNKLVDDDYCDNSDTDSHNDNDYDPPISRGNKLALDNEAMGYAATIKVLNDDNGTQEIERSNLEEQEIESEKRHIIYTHYYNGGNLENKMEFLSEEEKHLIAKKLLTGLSWLHSDSLKIFHGDLKPNNVFLEADPETGTVINAVIGDFGFACDLSDPKDRFYKWGFNDYKAPELKSKTEGTPIDESIFAADVYAIGLVLKSLFGESCKNQKINSIITKMLQNDLQERVTAEQALTEFLTLDLLHN